MSNLYAEKRGLISNLYFYQIVFKNAFGLCLMILNKIRNKCIIKIFRNLGKSKKPYEKTAVFVVLE